MGWLILLAIVAVVWILSVSGAKQKTNRTASSASGGRYGAPASHEVSRNRNAGVWISPGQTVDIAGLDLTCGMVYVGGVLPQPRGYGNENCLIDPSLRVAGSNPDILGSSLGYWPSYAAITPQARLAYLIWLAGGRSDPAAGIGYVFLFFYGLERRVFVDGAKAELPQIVAEVERLLEIYGENSSFKGYARRFLDVAQIAAGNVEPPALRVDLRDGYEIPVAVRVHLGRRLKAGEPLGADDALLWVLALPDFYPRTAASRCFTEFVDLWRTRFAEIWPAGLRVRAPTTELRVAYRSASGTFNGELAVDGLPDIAAVSAPLRKLRDLAEACTEDLDAYSRLLGRRPETRGTLEAAVLLPAALHGTRHAQAMDAVRGRLEDLMAAGDVAEIGVRPMAALIGCAAEAGARGALLRQIGGALDAFGLGFEPDRRFGASGGADVDDLVVFRLPGEACDPENPAFASARTMAEIGALAAVADGAVVGSEIEAIRSDLFALEGLNSAERIRLLAYLQALLKAPPKQTAALNRLAKTPLADRDAIAQAALGAVLADGRVTPAEVKYLERLNKALGLPAEDIYAALHRGSVRVDEPVVIVAAAPTRGSPIPSEPAASIISFDPARLQRVLQETSAVSTLLAGIFTEAPEAPTPAPTPSRPSRFEGLDAAHGELLAVVSDTGACPWSAFSTRARELKLLPEGALETINEWAFDRFDEPLLEGGDMVVAAAHLRAQLQLQETSA